MIHRPSLQDCIDYGRPGDIRRDIEARAPHLFARRQGARFNRRGIGGNSGGPSDPIDTILGTLGSTIQGYWHAHYGIGFAATLAASGTSPPAITISGSPAERAAIRLEIEDGATTFRYSADDGTTWIESGVAIPAPSASYTAIGPLTGITFIFPASGTYNTDQFYRARVANWLDISGRAHDLNQSGTTARPIYEYQQYGTGTGSVLFDGADDFLAATSPGLMSAASGSDVAVHIFLRVRLLATTGSPRLASFGGAAANANNLNVFIGSSNQYGLQKAGATSLYVTVIESSGTWASGDHVIAYSSHGTTGAVAADGAAKVSGALDTDTATYTKFYLGCRTQNTNDAFANMRLHQAVVAVGALSASQISTVQSAMATA